MASETTKTQSKKDGKIIVDLTRGPIMPALLKFAIPVMLANLFQTLYNMVDMIIVGQFVGSKGLSAVSVGGDIIHFFMFLCMGFSLGGQIMISQYVGAGRHNDLNKVIGTLLTFLMSIALIMTLPSIFCSDLLLGVLHAPTEAYDGAKAYTICSLAGLVFMFGYNTFAAILRGMGDSKHPMIFIALAAVVNTLLDLLFIGVFDMRAFGAALATIIAQGLSCVLCIIYLYRNRVSFCFDFKWKSFRIHKEPLKVIVRLGIPIAIQNSAATLSGLFVASFVNSYGLVVSAITGVGNKLNSLALIVANAMNTAGAAVIGQSFGAGKMDRIKGSVYRVFLTDLAFISTLTTLVLIFPEAVFSLFDSSPEVLAMSHQYAPVVAVAFMGFVFRSPSLALINGLGNSNMNFWMGIVEGFILRIGLTCLLGLVLGLGIYGFWYGSTIASYGYAVVVFPYFFSGRWKNYKKSVI